LIPTASLRPNNRGTGSSSRARKISIQSTLTRAFLRRHSSGCRRQCRSLRRCPARSIRSCRAKTMGL
jgi:hypothetical protein